MRATADVTAEAIKVAAKRLFATLGYTETTTRQIASAVSLEAGSIYYHFRSKNDILAELLVEGNELLLYASRKIVREKTEDPVDLLRRLFRAHIQILAGDPALFMVLTRELNRLEGDQRIKILRLRKEYERLLQGALQRAIDAGKLTRSNVKVVSFGIIGCLNTVAAWYDPKGILSLEQIAQEFTNLLLHGLLIQAGEAWPVSGLSE